MVAISHNSVAIAGEFAVLSQLALRGFDANMTLGNTKSVDILVADPLIGNMFKIEVKTHYGNKSSHSKLFGHTLDWVMSEKQESIIASNLFYIFVRIAREANSFRFFIVPSERVAKYVKEAHRFWKETRTKEGKVLSEDNKVRVFRIGLDEQGYKIKITPLAKGNMKIGGIFTGTNQFMQNKSFAPTNKYCAPRRFSRSFYVWNIIKKLKLMKKPL